MKTVHRQFGKFMRRDAGDTANCALLIDQFEEADKMLSKIIEACRAWRDSWVTMLSVQLGTIRSFDELYKPIKGDTDIHGNEPVTLHWEKLDRISKLLKIYADLKNDLSEDIKMIDYKIVQPAVDAKELIQPLKKIIKKRENKRLDLEVYANRVDGYTKKMKRTDRENLAFAKAEEELTQAANMLKLSDEQLGDILPSTVSATYSILPHLLSVQIMIQTSLVAHCYTALHNYCIDANFPSPPPPMEDVIMSWRSDFTPVQQKAETIKCIAHVKILHPKIAVDGKGATVPSHNLHNSSHYMQPSSSALVSSQNPMTTIELRPKNVSPIQSSNIKSIPSIRPHERSFNLESPPCTSSEKFSSVVSNSHCYSQSPAASHGQIGKKKPPPPPPKRIGSQKKEIYATALYSFEAQNPGDLSFEEGDVITVIKKTDSTDDWWEGKLHGRQGSFPANYCKIS